MARFIVPGFCIVLVVALITGNASGDLPDPSRHTPNIYWRNDDEQFRILKVVTKTWRDGKLSGIALRWLSGLPNHCWAIEYEYVWNDESASAGHRKGDPDPESIIVFVDDAGKTIGVQARVHWRWLPINTALMPWAFDYKGHIKLAFAANVHTPGAGLLHCAGLLAARRAPEWMAKAVASGIVPSVEWAAAANDYLAGLVRKGGVHNGGYRYPLQNLGVLPRCPH